jgi:hypothetical protein
VAIHGAIAVAEESVLQNISSTIRRVENQIEKKVDRHGAIHL